MTVPHRRLLAARGVRVACALLAIVFVIALLAPVIAPYDARRMFDPVHLRNHAPSFAHPMGTDSYSRDVLSRMMHGARVSLALALGTMSLATLVGALVGVASGYAGGRTDRALMRLVDIALSVPRVLLLLVLAGLWGAPSLLTVTLVLAATGWMTIARVTRSETRALRQSEQVAAARALGLADWQIAVRHVLPAVVPVIAVLATYGFGQTLLLESGLSFLGLGVQAPLASWGTVLLDVSDVVGGSRWLAVGPGLVLGATVMAVHRLADGVDDAFGAVTRHDTAKGRPVTFRDSL